MHETPFEDTQETFLGLVECFAEKAETDESHPLNCQQLTIAQDKDKTIQKIRKMPKRLYFCKDFQGGGKKTSLICFKEKIVIPGQLQKHVISWYHTTLCHPDGINRTEETIGQHLWWPKMRTHITNYVQICPFMSKKQKKTEKVWISPTKVS
jgi:hypothetical protein